jgi:hypothetical protein
MGQRLDRVVILVDAREHALSPKASYYDHT